MRRERRPGGARIKFANRLAQVPIRVAAVGVLSAVAVALAVTAAAVSAPGNRPVAADAYWTAGGRLITFWDGSRQLWMMKANGTHSRPVAPYSDVGNGEASTSPSGRLVAISTVYGRRATRGLLVVRRPGAKRSTARFRLGRLPTDGLGEPAWAPAEDALAVDVYLYGATERSHIFVADRKTGVRDISAASSSRDEESPAWSPNGREIAFLSCAKTGTGCDVVITARDGSHRRAVLRNIEPQRFTSASQPAWAPSGRMIALVLRKKVANPEKPQRYLLHTIRLRRSKARLIATTAVADQFWISIAWSPDGRRLAFSDPSGLWSVDVATGRKRLLTELGRDPRNWSSQAVSWIPSRRILFTYGDGIYTMLPGRPPTRIPG
jgi:dipeptidyl aminopeptidase/acylaminoacyl peptidase